MGEGNLRCLPREWKDEASAAVGLFFLLNCTSLPVAKKLCCKKEVMALRLMTVRTVSDKEEKADASGNIFLKVLTFFGRF